MKEEGLAESFGEWDTKLCFHTIPKREPACWLSLLHRTEFLVCRLQVPYSLPLPFPLSEPVHFQGLYCEFLKKDVYLFLRERERERAQESTPMSEGRWAETERRTEDSEQAEQLIVASPMWGSNSETSIQIRT